MEKPVLYYAPPSFYSQIAYLALVEKGMAFGEEIVIPGPPNYGTYQPEYMTLNPGGTVPTLVANGEFYDDSRKIIDLLLELDEGQDLAPHNISRVEAVHWIDRAYGLSERELAYGRGKQGKLGAIVNKKRLAALVRLRAENADLAWAYTDKIADIEDFMQKAADNVHVAGVEAKFDTEMDALDAVLGQREFVAGGAYSMADVCWTVVVARQFMLKRARFDERKNLARWFGEMKRRPSYKRAEVMDKFRISVMWKMISSLWKK